ncbi:MAG: DUF448 domain-containing protein [Candidatus Limnocylindrus sp.]
MLCRHRLNTRQLLRVGRESSGNIRIGGRGGRGAWVCADTHEGSLRAAIQQGLRGPVRDEEFELIDQARRAWIAAEDERRGA